MATTQIWYSDNMQVMTVNVRLNDNFCLTRCPDSGI